MADETRRALITGVNGQDGSYLAELLLGMGYEVHGIVRRQSVSESQTARIEHLDGKHPRFHTHYGDVTDATSVYEAMLKCRPHEVYNLAAQSHVAVSFWNPHYTAQVNAIGALTVLEATRHYELHHADWRVRYYQASSSEMFGNTIPSGEAANEETLMRPVSPYGCAKLFAYNMVRSYREGYSMHASNGILFNHSSPRRGRNFVEAKIVDALLRRKFFGGPPLVLGNLQARRDLGWSPEYVTAMKGIMEHHKPDDFVIATGSSVSVGEMAEYVCRLLNLYRDDDVRTNEEYKRPSELHYLRGDSSKAFLVLGWRPTMFWRDVLFAMVGERGGQLGVAGEAADAITRNKREADEWAARGGDK